MDAPNNGRKKHANLGLELEETVQRRPSFRTSRTLNAFLRPSGRILCNGTLLYPLHYLFFRAQTDLGCQFLFRLRPVLKSFCKDTKGGARDSGSVNTCMREKLPPGTI